MKITIKTESPEATRRLGVDFGSLLSGPHTVLLTGGMGAGKTAVTKGIVEGMGIFDDVSSPTYTLVNAYEDGDKKVYHFDLYRLEHAFELEDTGIFDVLGYEGACLLEWGEQFQDELTDEYLGVIISRVDGDESLREIALEPHGARAERLAAAVDDAVRAGATA